MTEKDFRHMSRGYAKNIRELRKKSEKGERIRAGFAVVFDSVFPMSTVMELMLRDDFFEPILFIIPDVARGKKHEIETYVNTKVKLSEKYGNAVQIVPVVDVHSSNYIDITDMCDMYCTANPYDSMTHPLYGVKNFWKRGIPVFFTDYGIAISSFYDSIMSDPNHYGKFWRIFCETKYVYDLVRNRLPWVDAVYSGYPKMDRLASFEKKEKSRKTIIIAPHHTVGTVKGSVNFSNFYNYHDLFLEIPKLYPQIDFIFRPHPLLFTALSRDVNWGESRLEEYINKMKQNSNVEIQNGGDYLETFVNSDALIHDCGSFTAEYLYLDKPVCRILRSRDDLDVEYNSFARECLACHELVDSRDGILRFINDVVLDGKDEKHELRKTMMHKLKKNFPHVSESIVKNLKAAIINA